MSIIAKLQQMAWQPLQQGLRNHLGLEVAIGDEARQVIQQRALDGQRQRVERDFNLQQLEAIHPQEVKIARAMARNIADHVKTAAQDIDWQDAAVTTLRRQVGRFVPFVNQDEKRVDSILQKMSEVLESGDFQILQEALEESDFVFEWANPLQLKEFENLRFFLMEKLVPNWFRFKQDDTRAAQVLTQMSMYQTERFSVFSKLAMTSANPDEVAFYTQLFDKVFLVN